MYRDLENLCNILSLTHHEVKWLEYASLDIGWSRFYILQQKSAYS